MTISLGQLRTEAAAVGELNGFAANSPQGDAFRHMYTSAVLTQMFGESIARVGGDMVELMRPNNPIQDRNMDLLNNRLGREVGSTTSSNLDAASRIAELIRNNTAVTDFLNDPRTHPANFPPELVPGATGNFPQGDPITGMPWPGTIDPTTNTLFQDAQNFDPYRDPLVLDLDGDGLELIAANGTILFDHNADGIKTGTGWVRPDDGLLVRDLNGNGLIDSGRELFGIDTLKANNTLATNGFDALRELDSNADGFITNLDTAYVQLKVWRDTNQDGISQAAELQSLDALGISSIGVNGTATGPQAGQIIAGNRVDLSTTFTQNGATRTVGTIDFQVNNFYSQFSAQVVDQAGNPVAITAQALALPQMNGSGMVRNMQAAASLSGEFAGALAAYAQNPAVIKFRRRRNGSCTVSIKRLRFRRLTQEI